jgi:shikimate kinase
MNKLIVLRGPSGAGKSTVAKALMEQTSRPVVLVDLDQYRFSFVNPPKKDHGLEYEMSASDVRIGLKLGFDVIFDGNFSADAEDPFLKKLFADHSEENYIFYLDASLQTTLERHKTKTNPRIDTNKMEEVYKYASPTSHEREVIIPEESTLQQTVTTIRRIAGI